MKSYLRDLFRYNHNANTLLINSFDNTANEGSIKLFCHILNTQANWMARINSQPNAYNFWQIHSLQDLSNINNNTHAQTMGLLEEGESDLQMLINYKNSKGEAFTNTIRDILIHLLNHSTYHRGQVAIALRQSGIQPPITDYIAFKR